MPVFFLSGALFPLTNLPAARAAATRIDRLTCGIDGLRGAFIGLSHVSMVTGIVVLGGVASIVPAPGARAFSKIQIQLSEIYRGSMARVVT